MSARKAQCWTYSLHALTWVPDGGKWSASGPICSFLGKAVVSIFFYESWRTPYLVWTLPCRNKSLAPTEYRTEIPWSPSLQPSPHNTITIHMSCNDIPVSSSKDFRYKVLTLPLSCSKKMWKQHKE